MMKQVLYLACLVMFLVTPSWGAGTVSLPITFSGGGASDLVVTVTSELRIPVYGRIPHPGILFTLVWEDVFNTDQTPASGLPATPYTSGIRATMMAGPGGPTWDAAAYESWGTSGRDLEMTFRFNLLFGSQMASLVNVAFPDNDFVIHPGSVTLPASAGMPLPTNAPSGISLYAIGVPVPEPSFVGLLGMGALLLLRRRKVS
ncbi:MAG: PEP-CTERM sorting domain-containing protein [Akkermansiaceae bacterium]|nr:PEP-CTERM sorting domain-containing protein [Akkermansiaceae bacterium]